ncbi:hypothetical protein Tco_1330830, partial [Tanacetum coccineum]
MERVSANCSRTTTTEEDQELDGEDDEKSGIAYVDSKEYNEHVSKKRNTLYYYGMTSSMLQFLIN